MAGRIYLERVSQGPALGKQKSLPGLFVKSLLVANPNILVFFDSFRTFICISQRNAMTQMVFRETLSGAGQVRIGE